MLQRRASVICSSNALVDGMGRNVQKSHDNCFKIFVHASHFHESDHRLRNTVPADRPDQLPLVAHPSMVLSAFATELYLKCLLCLETGRAPHGHHLRNLFDQLLPETRERLKALWDRGHQKTRTSACARTYSFTAGWRQTYSRFAERPCSRSERISGASLLLREGERLFSVV